MDRTGDGLRGLAAGMPWEALNGAIDLLRSTIQDCLGLGAEEGIDWCRGLEWAECV